MAPVISFRDIRSQADVAAWLSGVDERWPQRAAVVQHIVDQVRALPGEAPAVLELAPGPGRLAEALLTALPHLRYTGIDSSGPLITFAEKRLAPFGDRARLIRADLNDEGWLDKLAGNFQAIVSMQSLHDLGGQAEVDRIYKLARPLLVPGGLFLNADLVIPPGEARPENPGRLSIARHLELLRNHGYTAVRCTLELGEFGCCVGYRRDSE